MPSPQFSMWLLTVPVADFVSTDALPNNVKYIKGQKRSVLVQVTSTGSYSCPRHE